MYTIDEKNRRIIISGDKRENIVINEFDRLTRKFLPNTQDKYECELVLLEVPKNDIVNEDNNETEIKAFARRIGSQNWLIEFNESEFIIGG